MTKTIWELQKKRNKVQAEALMATFDFAVDSGIWAVNNLAEELYAELGMADREPLYEDPGARFETLGRQVPSQQHLLLKSGDLLRIEYGFPSRR